MTIEQIRAAARELYDYNTNGLIRPENELEIIEGILNVLGAGNVAGLEWNEFITYNLTDALYAEAHGRFYKSKVVDNVGNEPPSVQDILGNFEDAFWVEVSPSDSSSIKEWLPGLYQGGLQIVYYDYAGTKTEWAGVKLWKLDTATRPYESTDINAEIEDPSAIWVPAQQVGGNGEFNGARAIKSIPIAGFTPGGTTLGEWIENAFYPFLQATISLNTFPLQEVGVSYAPVVVGTITLRDETIVNARRVMQDGVSINNPAGNSINYTAPAFTILVGDNKTYRIEADVDNNGNPATKQSPSRKVEGVFPYLIGSSTDPALTGAALYNALSKMVEKEGDKSFTFNFTDRYAYFCIHEDYVDLVQILDQNGFPLPDFLNSKALAPATKTGAWTENYKVYRSGLTTINNGTFQFNN